MELQVMEIETTIDAELDLLPEQCHYRDEGCELANSCLNCPFPECVFDQPGGKRKFLKEQRNGEIVRLFDKEKKSVKELAHIFKLSVRTIQKALKEQH
jgi:uncharacterized protein with von Willebrand factor type A (vWA) domain